MGMLDGILGDFTGSGQGNAAIASLAEKVGLTPEQAQSAIGALAHAHPQPGDTVLTASNETGIAPNVLQQVVGHLGGEGALATIASSMLGGVDSSGAA